MGKKFFFDVTDLRGHVQMNLRVSGIERVCLKLIDHMLLSPPKDAEIWLSYWDKRLSRYQVVRGAEPDHRRIGAPDHFAERLGIVREEDSTLPSLGRYRPGSQKYRFHKAVRDLNAALGNEGHFRKRGISVADWKAAKAPKSDPAVPSTAPRHTPQNALGVIQAGDVVTLLGAFWGNGGQGAALKTLKDAGAEVVVLIHDLIPVLQPETVAQQHGLAFHDALLETAGYASRYLANSDCTARDMQAFLDGYGFDQTVDVLPLAQAGLGPAEGPSAEMSLAQAVNTDLYPNLIPAADVSEEVRALSKYPFALFVGTWDTRKNLWRLAQAWQRLVARPELDMPKLVVAGGPGWGSDDFRMFIDATGNLNGWVERIQHPSDTDLAYLYERCAFTLMPSLYEGWGLPVGESLAYGKTCVASDRSSIPEVGGDLVTYCDPTRIDSMAEAIASLVGHPEKRQALEAKIARAQLRGWADVVTDLKELLGR